MNTYNYKIYSVITRINSRNNNSINHDVIKYNKIVVFKSVMIRRIRRQHLNFAIRCTNIINYCRNTSEK